MSPATLHPEMQKFCSSLDELTKKALTGWQDDRCVSDNWGWNFPAMTRHDLSGLTSKIAEELRERGMLEVDQATLEVVKRWQLRIPNLQTMIDHFYNGHGQQAIPCYLVSIDQLRKDLEPILGWQTIRNVNALPPKLARRIRAYESELNAITPNKADLEKRIALINDATSAAESLPTDLEALHSARKSIEDLHAKCSVMLEKILEYSNESSMSVISIKQKNETATRLIDQCEEAYRITTTKGLAGAFDKRHSNLTLSMWAWVFVLLLALGLGYYFGNQKLKDITSILNSTVEQRAAIWPNFVLAVFSFGSPIWVAWIATKQISHRFRLAEDYAFKASVAKAYEGYRKEAARLDEKLEKRLFESALTRLEEAPLRLVESRTPGSPWHEFFESESFRDALKSVPGLKDKFSRAKKSAENALSPLNGKNDITSESHS